MARPVNPEHPVIKAAIDGLEHLENEVLTETGLKPIRAVLQSASGADLEDALRSLLYYAAFVAAEGGEALGKQLLGVVEDFAATLSNFDTRGAAAAVAAQLGSTASKVPVGHEAPVEGSVRGPLALRFADLPKRKP